MANDLIVFGLYTFTCKIPFPLNSKHRVIWVSKFDNLVTLIRTDAQPYKKPKSLPYNIVLSWVQDKKLLLIENEYLTPQLRLSDEQLEKRYSLPKRKSQTEDDNEDNTSTPLAYRKKWLPFIEDVTPGLPDAWRNKIKLSSLLKPSCKHRSLPLNQAYQVLYRYLVNRCSKLSVISETYNCGNLGQKRVGKGFALGRLTIEAKSTNLKNTNFKLTPDWLRKISDVYQETIVRGVTGGKAYSTFLNLHCITSVEKINEKVDITYLPIGSRPSKSQFLSNGPDGDYEQMLWRKQLLEQEYEKNYRPLDGYAEPTTPRTGVLAHVDASSNDRYLVSIYNAIQSIGTARAIPVVDQNIGYIWGFYCGFRVNKEAARLAILNAATDKVAMCAKYGITIQPNEWHSCLPGEFIADKGEFNCEEVRESLGETQRSIEYVATGRADLRGLGERTHGLLHDHDANGSTYGKFRQRGEKDPALQADQNIFEFTRELIRRVITHNNYAPAPHLLTTEMRQAGIKPTRRAILEFCMDMGYHHVVSYHEDDLILALAPEYDAVVTRDGVYPIVRRDYDSGDEIILRELRYLGEFVKLERWLESVRRTDRRFRIKVRMNPNEPSCIWYQDPDTGLHRFDLATNDPLIARLATVHDLSQQKTIDTISLKSADNEYQEQMARNNLQNEADRALIKQKKRETKKTSPGKSKDSSKASGRRFAMQKEVAAAGQTPVPISCLKQEAPPSEFHRSSNASTNNVIPIHSPPPLAGFELFEEWIKGGET